eukprot:scaffold22238_cov62-Phaeocystis_antarctica.AAC.2
MPRKPKDAAPAAASDRLKVETTTSSSGGGKRKGEPSTHAGDIRGFFQKPRASSTPLAARAPSDDAMDEALMAHMDRIEASPIVQSLTDDATDEALMAHMDHMDASASQHQLANSISPQPPRPPPPPLLPTACAARPPRLGSAPSLLQLGLFQRPPPPPLPEYPVPDASSADPLRSAQRVVRLQFDRFDAGPASSATASPAAAAAVAASAPLNERQRLVATSSSGQLSVRAGAGTGKTFTMMQRALYLFQQQAVPPSRILMVTFSVKAADELKSRLDVAFGTPPPQPPPQPQPQPQQQPQQPQQPQLPQPPAARTAVSHAHAAIPVAKTFHALAFFWVRTYWQAAGLGARPTPLTGNALLTMALLTMALLTMALLTVALLTVAGAPDRQGGATQADAARLRGDSGAAAARVARQLLRAAPRGRPACHMGRADCDHPHPAARGVWPCGGEGGAGGGA